MAKEYLAAKTPGGRRIHIWSDDASFSEYCYDREEVIKDKVGTTNDGFVIHNDGVVYNDELGIYG